MRLPGFSELIARRPNNPSVKVLQAGLAKRGVGGDLKPLRRRGAPLATSLEGAPSVAAQPKARQAQVLGGSRRPSNFQPSRRG